MKNIYNFNIEVVTPKKSPKEEKLFEKWKHILKRRVISDELINEYKKDLLTLTTVLLIGFSSFGQSTIIAAGNQTETFGETFPLMQQIDTTIVEVSLGVPKYEIEQPQKTIVKKKVSIWEKFINFIKNLINKKQ